MICKRGSYEGNKAPRFVIFINGNGSVNVVDAQVTYDIATGVRTTVSSSAGGLGGMGWLIADVNGDHHVDAADALAIQNRVVRGA